ncbi:MAG: hypothetical protein HY810_06825, partial [Candidatus Omnitrophica bacterium]|nr:hypothetical protein [Candidatus Omnitrophota bacterium]
LGGRYSDVEEVQQRIFEIFVWMGCFWGAILTVIIIASKLIVCSRKMQLVHNKIEKKKKRKNFIRNYPWAERLINIMEEKKVPFEFMMERAIPNANNVINTCFIASSDREKAKTAVC